MRRKLWKPVLSFVAFVGIGLIMLGYVYQEREINFNIPMRGYEQLFDVHDAENVTNIPRSDVINDIIQNAIADTKAEQPVNYITNTVPPLDTGDTMPAEERQYIRKKRVAEYCSNADLRITDPPRKLFHYKEAVTYCRINKCASTFTIMALYQLFPCNTSQCDQRTAYQNENYALYGLTPKEKAEYIQESFSFFFAREPYRRLFSTYSNKFYLPKEHWRPIGTDIARKYRTAPSRDSIRYGHDVTFRELIQYVVDEFESDASDMDVHIRPMHLLCNPCEYQFKFIGHLETISSDWEMLINTWKTLGLTEDGKHNVTNNATSELKHLFRTMYLVRKSTISTYSLFQRTWAYFQVVGRISKHIAMPFTGQDMIANSSFYDAVVDAMAKSKALGKELTNQRDEALHQAYATVPRDLLERLRKVVLVDCKLFGYNDKPDWLFDDLKQHVKTTDHKYFVGI